MLITAKVISVMWMLAVLALVLMSILRLVNKGEDPFSMVLAGIFAWGLFGFVPVFVAKFAWGFIK